MAKEMTDAMKAAADEKELANKSDTPDTSGEEKDNRAAKTADERVEVFVERAHVGEDPNLLVSINGVNFLLPRGKASLVPKYVADEIRRSQKAQSLYDRRVQEMSEASK